MRAQALEYFFCLCDRGHKSWKDTLAHVNLYDLNRFVVAFLQGCLPL